MKPSTALPWKGCEGSPCAIELYGEQTIWLNREKDAAYIVHAVNAYPKLVEALRDLVGGYRQADEGGDAGGVIGAANDAESLLVSLGEQDQAA